MIIIMIIEIILIITIVINVIIITATHAWWYLLSFHSVILSSETRWLCITKLNLSFSSGFCSMISAAHAGRVKTKKVTGSI